MLDELSVFHLKYIGFSYTFLGNLHLVFIYIPSIYKLILLPLGSYYNICSIVELQTLPPIESIDGIKQKDAENQ